MEKFVSAIRKDNIKYIKNLIKKGENLNIRVSNGESPIILAIKLGHYKVVKLLIESGIALDIQNDNGITPLVYSIINNNESSKLTEMLVEAGAKIDFNTQDEDVLEDIEKFISCNSDLDVAGLLRKGLDKALENLGDRYLEGASEDENEFKKDPKKILPKDELKNIEKIVSENLEIDLEEVVEEKKEDDKHLEEYELGKKVYIVKGFFKSYFTKRLDKEEFEIFLLEKGEEILNSKDYRKFSNGDRIKKIRSEDKVFELRINSGDRVLFTITEMGIIFLCVDKHDNAVGRGTRVTTNEIIQLEISEKDIEEVEIRKVIERPIYESISLEKFKSKLLDKKELYLLTSEQERVVNSSLPICLYGSAGSGKTTMLLKKIENILKHNDDTKILFLTYNEKLLKYTKTLYNTYSGYKTEQITFDTFENYFINLLKLDREGYIDTRRFLKWFGAQKGYNPKLVDVSPLEAFSEIKGIIKGFVGYSGKRDIKKEKIISKNYYLELKNRYSLLKNDVSRELIYEEAKSYEKYLRENNYYDENDLALEYLNSDSDYPKYDFLACDEVQDLTELQIIAMLETLVDNKNVFLTGDNNQAINLSFFDFSRLKTLYQERYHYYGINNNEISLNQRSSETVVNLAKKVAELRDSVLPVNKKISYSEKPLIEGGIVPILASQEDIELSQLENKDVTIIVPDEVRKKRIKRFYNNTVLTIYEAKGLERENIVCIGLIDSFSDDAKTVVEKLKSDNRDPLSNHYRHFFNLLYVATTRARNNLIFLDDLDNEFYNYLDQEVRRADTEEWQERFKSLAELTEDKLLKYAVEYEEKGNYKIALEHYEKMKERDENSIKRLKALIEMESKNYRKALETFESLEMWTECLECSKNIGEKSLEKRYQIKVYESEGKYLDLARYYSSYKNYQSAFDSYIDYFKEELKGSKDIKEEFYTTVESIDGKIFKKGDHDFIVMNSFEIPQLLELAVDISLLIKGDIDTGIELLEKLSKRSKRAEFNLFLLKKGEELWDKPLEKLLDGEEPLYKNFYLKGRNKKKDELVWDNLSLENLDLFVKNGYKADLEAVDGEMIIKILEEDRKNLIHYYILNNGGKDRYRKEVEGYLESLIEKPKDLILEKFDEFVDSPCELLLNLYLKYPENENIKSILNEKLVLGELSLESIDRTYIDLIELETYLEIRGRGDYNRDNLLSSLDYRSMEIGNIFKNLIDEELELLLILFLEKKRCLIPFKYYEKLDDKQMERFKKYFVSYECRKISTKYSIYNISEEAKELRIDEKIYANIEPMTQVELELVGKSQLVSLGKEEKVVTIKDIVLGKDKIIFE